METFISICALSISVIAIVISSRDNKNQIKVEKIEEIYELTISLYSRYSTLYELYLLFERFTTITSSSNQKKFSDEYFKFWAECERVNMYQDTYTKIFRLNVLANAYLNKKLKIEILAYTDLFENLTEAGFHRKLEYHVNTYKTGFPQQINLSKFVDHLESKFIDEINMVGDKFDQNEVKKYRDREFREKLGLRAKNINNI